MKKLSSPHVAETIRIQCYKTFIQSTIFASLIYTIFGHSSSNTQSSYNKVVKLAGEFGGCTFDDIFAVYNKAIKSIYIYEEQMLQNGDNRHQLYTHI